MYTVSNPVILPVYRAGIFVARRACQLLSLHITLLYSSNKGTHYGDFIWISIIYMTMSSTQCGRLFRNLCKLCPSILTQCVSMQVDEPKFRRQIYRPCFCDCDLNSSSPPHHLAAGQCSYFGA